MRDRRQLVGLAALAAVAITGAVMMLTTANVTNVAPGADLQAAINAAQCGDTLVLQAGADYTGDFILPAKGCTSYITIKSSGYDQMPARGFYERQPSTATQALMARVHSALWTEATFATALSAGYYKLLGMDISPNPNGQNYGIVELGESGNTQDTVDKVAHHLVVDKNWIHGAETQEVQRCVALNSADTELTNNWITGCHGRGYDTQAIGGWNGIGRYKIINNYLEGSGENTMFGGATGGLTGSPSGYTISDIEFRRNYSYKPPAWKGVWTVKNLFELKNAKNVVIDGNVFENNWTDAQAGWAIQFTPRPSDSGAGARIEDVVFTNNVIKNSDQGANFLGMDQPPAPTDVRLKRMRVANNLFENIRGTLFTITNGVEALTIENTTALQGGNMISSDYAPSTNLVYRNNIQRHNDYGIFGSGHSIGNDSIAFYFPSSTITGNVIAREVNAPSSVTTLYPAGNVFPATLAECFSDATSYQVAPAYAGKGADYNAILAAQGGGSATPTPVPTATASPVAESPNNTRVGPAAQIIDSVGAVWTKAASGAILRNGQPTSGAGSVILYCNHIVYAFGTDSQWYKWGNNWAAVGVVDPCGGQVPSPTPTVAPTVTPTPAPLPSPSPSPAACQPTSWPNSVGGQNAQMEARRAQGCYPVQRTNNGMNYARP